ncbi:MAG: hypothetical protein IKE61_00390 [Coriobacteriales bacterium]|nr:hypothetical protein [Coriobacteriales bacterium]
MSDFLKSAGEFFDKAAETVGRTGKFGKLKASIANNSRKQNDLFEEVGELVLTNEALRAALAEVDASYLADFDELVAAKDKLEAELAELREEGLIPDDDDDEEAVEIVEAQVEEVADAPEEAAE